MIAITLVTISPALRKAMRNRYANDLNDEITNDHIKCFRDIALRLLDDAYRFALFLMGDQADVEQAGKGILQMRCFKSGWVGASKFRAIPRSRRAVRIPGPVLSRLP
ncbi:hypothetical protein IVB38_10865 [Bradyrhizobium sp. 38]|uniref:hypothetical protein n=1 Tax=unclassified Bradyrhizobium TaxID=2631580 RepID=UPI001FF8EEFE|nr:MULTISPECIES: hypothetical protein [unclassified Bradyrhizobium]MCK1336522.1 hypothetical protein [Bradyrhizobium sp. 38]MCK1776451.1 hypothetical protein [Bradyrhizobium sp. 132]